MDFSRSLCVPSFSHVFHEKQKKHIKIMKPLRISPEMRTNLRHRVEEVYGSAAKIESCKEINFLYGSKNVFWIYVIVTNNGKILQGIGETVNEIVESLGISDKSYSF